MSLKSSVMKLPPKRWGPPQDESAPLIVKIKTVQGRLYKAHVSRDTPGHKLEGYCKPETDRVVGCRLICRGLDIDPEKTLKEQNIDKNTTVYRIRLYGNYVPEPCDPRSPPIETLEVLCENGQSILISAHPDDSIDALQKRIANEWNMLLGYSCRFFYNGVALGEAPYSHLHTLGDYGIPDKGSIILFQVKGSTSRDYKETLFKITN